MRSGMLTLVLMVFVVFANAQQDPALIDTLKAKVARSKTTKEKVDKLAQVSMVYANTNQAEADRYGDLMVREAELSRDRSLMAKAHFYNGIRYSFKAGQKEYVQKSIASYTKSYEVAKAAKLDQAMTEALIGLADIQKAVPDLDKALNYTTQAAGLAAATKNDSLQTSCYLLYGDIYNRKKERLLALRNYLQALRIAEENNHANTLRACYSSLSSFYASIKEYDKAIDFLQKAIDVLPKVTAENKEYQKVIDFHSMGRLYVRKKNFETAEYYYDESIRLGDSLGYAPIKMPAYQGLLERYIEANEPEKALAFFNKRTDLKEFITNLGYGHFVDEAYGNIFTKLHKPDSARYYFAKAAPRYEQAATPVNRLSFYADYAAMFKATGDLPSAIAYYSRAKSLADTLQNLEWQQETAKELDSLYAQTGNDKLARQYNNLYHHYADSLRKLGEQKDLMQTELADEQQRQERINREQQAALERKHTVQYTGITIAIALVFILLVAMGAFRVSETTIKVMGFFSFILLFEFIILLADTKIHHWTHGEPLPILAIKIVLIAALLPLHHWLEHKVVHYLTSRRRIIPERRSIWHALSLRRKPVVEGTHGVNHPH